MKQTNKSKLDGFKIKEKDFFNIVEHRGLYHEYREDEVKRLTEDQNPFMNIMTGHGTHGIFRTLEYAREIRKREMETAAAVALSTAMTYLKELVDDNQYIHDDAGFIELTCELARHPKSVLDTIYDLAKLMKKNRMPTTNRLIDEFLQIKRELH